MWRFNQGMIDNTIYTTLLQSLDKFTCRRHAFSTRLDDLRRQLAEHLLQQHVAISAVLNFIAQRLDMPRDVCSWVSWFYLGLP